MTERATQTQRETPKKEKQEKPSVQSTEEQQEEEAVENEAHHGGRTKWPDGDVNPASDIHVDEDEEGEPAPTSDHHAQRRDDKEREDKERSDKKDPRVS
ncbi:MAG: hypothetical protein KAH44_17285 [Oricola sp.]|jgi:hypothetical protein|nr:hypothetical protein [Oricola sp.]